MICPKCGYKLTNQLLGQTLGKLGGLAASLAMTPEQRRLRALHAVQARERYRKAKRKPPAQ